MMTTRMRISLTTVLLSLMFVFGTQAATSVIQQNNDRLTPIQREIEHQRQRLSSADIEERRDALMRLGNLHRAEASRVAAGALNDATPIVRVTAAHAARWLPSAEAATLLLPLLK